MSEEQSRPGEPEYLAQTPSGSGPHRGRRLAVLGVAAAGVVGVVGLGSWAAVSLMGGGAQPAEAIPANALGYVSLDLDPSAAQKIEAVRILEKFPAIDEELEISSRDDLRRWVFEQIQQDGTCTDLDYATDVEPWIGDRVALAGVPGDSKGDQPTPLVALQVTDADAATEGITRLAECGEAGEDFGVAIAGDYALISDSQEHADGLAASVENGSLADDAEHQTWMDRVGDPGIVTMYVAPGAVAALVDLQETMSGEMSPLPGARANPMFPTQPDDDAVRRQLAKMAEDFRGLAGVVRFEDGAVEAEFAGDTTGEDLASDGRAGVTELPDSTAVAFGVALPEGWAQRYLDTVGELMGPGGSMEQLLRDAEAMTGLELPEDIERLLGDGFAVAVDSSLDLGAASRDPMSVPAGIRVSGDPAEITDVVTKIKAALGPEADVVAVEEGEGVVALGVEPGYVSELAGSGELGDQATFQDVVAEPDRAAAVFFLDFDAVEEWVAQGMAQEMTQGGGGDESDQQVRENIAPLRALGISSWLDDDGTERALLRLSTD